MSNEWYEKGELPPVGSKVITDYPEASHKSAIAAHGKEVEIVAHASDVAIFKYRNDGCYWYHGFYKEYFIPIKSDREKAIESAVNSIKSGCDYDHSKDLIDWIAGRWYDKGLLRLPEEKQ